MKEGGREEWRREAVEAGETGSFRLGRAAGRRDTGSRHGRRASLQLRFLGVGPCVISTARRVRPPHPASAQQLVTTRSPPTIHAYRTQLFITPPSPCALHWHPQRPSDLSQSSPAWERHMQHAARILLGGGGLVGMPSPVAAPATACGLARGTRRCSPSQAFRNTSAPSFCHPTPHPAANSHLACRFSPSDELMSRLVACCWEHRIYATAPAR